ncbi:MAG: T9SS type A sorting domain-containing protein [Flavobacteriales bacterium]|nr:T9SS type A sorting domain-containing protein [Flavobacteriales bacterium]
MRIITPIVFFFSLLCQAQWTQLPDFPGTPRDDAAAFTVGGKIYVGTGYAVGWVLMNDWFCYDPATETWTSIASLPADPRQYCTTFTIADTGYVFGGLGPNGALDELWAYHPGTDQWEQKASLPAEPRYACVASWLYTVDAILATGMLASGVPTNEAWKYRSYDDIWSPLAPVPGPARHRAASFDSTGGLAVLGGADSAFNALKDCWRYPGIFQTGEWYAMDSLPEPRWGADGGGSGVHVLACGATTQQQFHTETWWSSNGWTALSPFPNGPRRGGVGSGILGSQQWTSTLYYGLGLDGTLARRNDWWRLDMIVGIEERDPITSFTLFPVPTDLELSVELHPKAIGASIMITTADGRTVHEQKVESSTIVIDTRNYTKGVYGLTVRTPEGVSTQRFVVQH